MTETTSRFNPKEWTKTYVGKGLICEYTGKLCFAKFEEICATCEKRDHV